MAYARMGDSDIYLIADGYGGWTCYACELNSHRAAWMNTIGQVKLHLQSHIDAGHIVGNAMNRVLAEIEEHGENWER